MLLAGGAAADEDDAHDTNHTPLLLAVAKDHKDVLQALLDAGKATNIWQPGHFHTLGMHSTVSWL